MMRRSPLVRKAAIVGSKVERTLGLGHRVAATLDFLRPIGKKESSVFRSRQHRLNVATLDCVHCGRQGRSQAAHLNLLAAGKGMGLKASDALIVPLCCDEPGRRGCHHALDQGAVYDKATSAALQIGWIQETRAQLRALRQWPEAAEADLERLLCNYLRRPSYG
ncbi:hypothetical protein [Bordetella sp. 02P26C-1]|uniref:hypothetical protein n=1 Tax=Bordetella sp. 02P26C-1 TaxID=2683195 RepID=UPI001355BA4A|nr:hypothetical protein [Bordetella sp. 02P26C-1]MVW80197.1 hypothetical protein [Bordetella sp. 02P26C-1]